MKSLCTVLFILLLSVLSPAAFAGPVDLNHADAPALAAAIDGVGPRLAEAIVAYRKAHGPFTSVDQLLAVKGIGPRVLERNRERLSVGRQEASKRP